MKQIAFFIALFAQISIFAQVLPSHHPSTQNQLTYRSYIQIPKQASLKAYTPYPKDQGINNNCVGWASAYVGRTVIEAMKLGWQDRDLITQRAFSPGFTYFQASKGKDTLCQEGIAIKDAMHMLKYQGAVPYEDFGNECPCNIDDTLTAQGLSYTIADYQRLFHQRDPNSHKIQSVKRSLAQNQPVVLGMRCPPSFEKAVDQLLWKPEEAPEEPVFFGHALAIVGYDDVRYGGAFELQNSWGTEWGNEGYIWVKYTDFVDFAKYAYTLISHEKAIIASTESSVEPNLPSAEIASLPAVGEQKREHESAKMPVQKNAMLNMITANGINMQATRHKDTYDLNIPYTYGEPLTLRVDAQHADYLYVFGWNAEGKLTPFYSHHRPLKSAEKRLLSETGIQIDTYELAGNLKTATDHLCVLLSDKPLEVDVILEQLGRDKGKVKKQLHKLLNRHLANEKNLTYKTDTIAVSGSSTNAIIPIFINAFHVP